MSRNRSLIIPTDGGDLTVSVDGDLAQLTLTPPGTDATEPAHDVEPAVVRVDVPARALVAALRVAWADQHDLRCFEPWRDVTSDHHWRGYEPYEGPGPWWDDLGDGDPCGYRDPDGDRDLTALRLPYRPARVLTAPRSGAAWEDYEHDLLREMWLAAAPDADKKLLIQTIAQRLERGVGGISARLRRAGCDPTRPGSPWDGTYDDPYVDPYGDRTPGDEGGSGDRPPADVVPLRRVPTGGG